MYGVQEFTKRLSRQNDVTFLKNSIFFKNRSRDTDFRNDAGKFHRKMLEISSIPHKPAGRWGAHQLCQATWTAHYKSNFFRIVCTQGHA